MADITLAKVDHINEMVKSNYVETGNFEDITQNIQKDINDKIKKTNSKITETNKKITNTNKRLSNLKEKVNEIDHDNTKLTEYMLTIDNDNRNNFKQTCDDINELKKKLNILFWVNCGVIGVLIAIIVIILSNVG